MGGLAQTEFKTNFVRGGFKDVAFKPWPEVQRRMKGADGKYTYKGFRGKKYTPADRTRAILVKSGALKRSIITKLKGANTMQVGSNKIYADTHNFGRAKGKIPKREFIGTSRTLNTRLEKVISDTIVRLMNNKK
jgi:phage gpG-like protein